MSVNQAFAPFGFPMRFAWDDVEEQCPSDATGKLEDNTPVLRR